MHKKVQVHLDIAETKLVYAKPNTSNDISKGRNIKGHSPKNCNCSG